MMSDTEQGRKSTLRDSGCQISREHLWYKLNCHPPESSDFAGAALG